MFRTFIFETKLSFLNQNCHFLQKKGIMLKKRKVFLSSSSSNRSKFSSQWSVKEFLNFSIQVTSKMISCCFSGPLCSVKMKSWIRFESWQLGTWVVLDCYGHFWFDLWLSFWGLRNWNIFWSILGLGLSPALTRLSY